MTPLIFFIPLIVLWVAYTLGLKPTLDLGVDLPDPFKGERLVKLWRPPGIVNAADNPEDVLRGYRGSPAGHRPVWLLRERLTEHRVP